MSRRRKKTKRRPTSRVSQHRRDGRQLQSPMNTISGLTLTSWLKDDVPDWLWPAILIADDMGGVLVGQVDMASKIVDAYVAGLLERED